MKFFKEKEKEVSKIKSLRKFESNPLVRFDPSALALEPKFQYNGVADTIKTMITNLMLGYLLF